MNHRTQDARHAALRNLRDLILHLEGVKLGVDTNNKDTISKHSQGRNIIDQAYEAWASVTTYIIELESETQH